MDQLKEFLSPVAQNLLTPIPMCFALGILCKLIHGGIKIPKDLYYTIAIFLLMSIGFIGGLELHEEYDHHGFGRIMYPASATLLLGCLTPIIAFCALRFIGRLSIADAAGIAAHYGSTSAVTYAVAQSFADAHGAHPDEYLPTLVTILECPGIAVALAIGAIFKSHDHPKGEGKTQDGHSGGKLGEALYEVVTGQSIMLMAGMLIIGFISASEMTGPQMAPFHDFFYAKGMIFRGALCIFLLEMGLVVGERLSDLLKVGPFLIAFGVLIPILHGFLGALLGHWAGLNLGGCTVFAAIVSSASYIAAPPAVRLTLPEANPTLSMTASLAITFPFNIAFGIPLYYQMAKMLGAHAVEGPAGAAGGHSLLLLTQMFGWA